MIMKIENTANAILGIMALFIIGVWLLFKTETIYSKTCIVTEIDEANDLVTVSTATGLLYQFYGVEDNFEGDLVSVTFFNGFTPKNVTDDAIIAHRYSSYTELFVEIEEGRVCK
jgi:hypothetical protein